MQLTQKETTLLKDLQDQEKVCVDKYKKYASEAKDGQLKNLFTQIAQIEQNHYDTISTIMQGQQPQMNSGSGEQTPSTFTATYTGSSNNEDKNHDSFLCSDLLATEKHVSSVYNTCIFEFNDSNIRNALNHIQKEEQQHGDSLYKYMSTNAMYG